jgi:hypothetical protein
MAHREQLLAPCPDDDPAGQSRHPGAKQAEMHRTISSTEALLVVIHASLHFEVDVETEREECEEFEEFVISPHANDLLHFVKFSKTSSCKTLKRAPTPKL